MPQDPKHLIWLDMEMTGLEPDTDRIIEIAMVVTDSELNVVAESPVLVVHQSDETLAAMDEWNTNTHGKTGLTARVKASTLSEAEAEQQLLAFLQEHIAKGVVKKGKHEALADILESIEELRYYREHFLKV